ncbi:DUF2190 family protein [Rhodococcus sp. IEGM 1366]|uniref:DUF2190 family protein n=1 Tax=Rhodococcus sp. IEGM 1366 TaxID=3082223 RepID=UPI002955A206|nr:DUF2190 family protein [Rhodococcus sp. IEGM 1366]MDV8065541.1 DUF2190 family protein [Rhodococcus sp. IEGM 1366]
MSSHNIDVYAPGADITANATAEVLAKRFVRITGNRTDGNIAVAHATAAGRIFGVAKHDAKATELVSLARGASRIVKVTTGATIAAFAEVEVGTDGKAITLAAGKAVGYAVTGATSGADAQISLY